MNNDFFDWKTNRNIYPVRIENKEKYLLDLQNIDNSWTGRLDLQQQANTFIQEAEQEIINAIELFEKGYFDCAYYSLRTSIELSTTMTFLSDLPREDREKYFSDWKEIKDFPMQGRMLGILSSKGDVFSDMKEKMESFFEHTKKLSKALNKYVHKQGFNLFYVSRNHVVNANKSREKFVKNFEYYLKQCIGVVAVMRLSIDPFPILLMDEEFLYRCFDSITEPYTADFVNEYIGYDIIEDYKKTDLYIGTYDAFISEPKKNEYTFELMKYQVINTNHIDEIIEQLSLLPVYDMIAVFLVAENNKINSIYCFNGLFHYTTDRKSKKIGIVDGMFLSNIQKATEKTNIKYDNIFLSVFEFNNEVYIAQHDNILTEDEYLDIKDKVYERLSKSLANFFNPS